MVDSKGYFISATNIGGNELSRITAGTDYKKKEGDEETTEEAFKTQLDHATAGIDNITGTIEIPSDYPII